MCCQPNLGRGSDTSVDISCCAVNSVCTTVVCSCIYIGDFFVAPNLFFLYTLLDPVPPPIYARCPAVLTSPPRFPTGYGPRHCLIPSTSTFRALTRPPFPFPAIFSNRRTFWGSENFSPTLLQLENSTHIPFITSRPLVTHLVVVQPPGTFLQARKILENHTFFDRPTSSCCSSCSLFVPLSPLTARLVDLLHCDFLPFSSFSYAVLLGIP